MGSALLFRHPDRDPTRSINFVTAHDGFTLNDLVSYNAKHNLANGEEPDYLVKPVCTRFAPVL